MTKIEIKKTTVSGFDDFYALFKKSLLDGYFLYSPNSSSFIVDVDEPKKELFNGISKGESRLFLAYIDSKAVGYLLTRKQYGGVAFGHWLAVDKAFRDKGVASSLLSHWESDALKQGAHMLNLYTTENDIYFYKKNGFSLAGSMPDAWFGVDHFLFYKTLRKSDEKVFLKDYLKKKGLE